MIDAIAAHITETIGAEDLQVRGRSLWLRKEQKTGDFLSHWERVPRKDLNETIQSLGLATDDQTVRELLTYIRILLPADRGGEIKHIEEGSRPKEKVIAHARNRKSFLKEVVYQAQRLSDHEQRRKNGPARARINSSGNCEIYNRGRICADIFQGFQLYKITLISCKGGKAEVVCNLKDLLFLPAWCAEVLFAVAKDASLPPPPIPFEEPLRWGYQTRTLGAAQKA